MATGKVTPKYISIWRDERVLKVGAQIISSLLVFGFLYWLIGNFIAITQQRGMPLTYGFLKEAAGFPIKESFIPYDSTMSFGRAVLVGLINTLVVSALGIVFATVSGFHHRPDAVILQLADQPHRPGIHRIPSQYPPVGAALPVVLRRFHPAAGGEREPQHPGLRLHQPERLLPHLAALIGGGNSICCLGLGGDHPGDHHLGGAAAHPGGERQRDLLRQGQPGSLDRRAAGWVVCFGRRAAAVGRPHLAGVQLSRVGCA